MKLSDFIIALQEIYQQHGELDVETYNSSSTRVVVAATVVAHRHKIMPVFWDESDGEELCGETVVRIWQDLPKP